jgi:hypothetical protein
MITALIDDIVLYKAACSGVSKNWTYISPHGNKVELEKSRKILSVQTI